MLSAPRTQKYRSQPLNQSRALNIGSPIISVSCTGNLSAIVAGAVDRRLYCFNHDLEHLWSKHLDNEVWSTGVSEDGNIIAAGTANKNPSEGTIYIFDRNGQIQFKTALGSPIWDIAVLKNAQRVVATTWNGSVNWICKSPSGWLVLDPTDLGGYGAYGVCESSRHRAVGAIAFGKGLSLLGTRDREEKAQFSDADTGYHLDYSSKLDAFVYGTSGGSLVLRPLSKRKRSIGKEISQRPICAVRIIDDGSLIFTGGFDGRLIVFDNNMDMMYSSAVDGEIWDIDTAQNGDRILVASGDGYLYLYRNRVDNSAMRELEIANRTAQASADWQSLANAIDATSQICSRLGCIEYGLSAIKRLEGKNSFSASDVIDKSIELVERGLQADSRHPVNNFKYAELLYQKGDYWNASYHFIVSSHNHELRQSAFTLAAECFVKIDNIPAAVSCFRRSKEQTLSRDDIRIIYNLARSLEDQGNYSRARILYGILLAWNPKYRDVMDRAGSMSTAKLEGDQNSNSEKDYTGLTVNLLGPEAPRHNAVAEELTPILQSRSRELHISEEQRGLYREIIDTYYSKEGSIRQKTKTELGYNIQSYIKYDFLLPEDELKKELERLNTLSVVHGLKDVRKSLDIGAATARWPRTFHSLGMEAYGIDVEENAIRYSNQKLSREHREGEFPKLLIGSGLDIPFDEGEFCIVTCMMGTFSHIEKRNHRTFFSECGRVLRTGGTLIVSTWDLECMHQSYLSMYTLAEKQKIDANSLSRAEMPLVAERCGLKPIDQIPFCMIPDIVSLEIGGHEITRESLEQILSVELAARACFPHMHGEMYISVFRKE